MRGPETKQSGMFHYFSVEERVPLNHPIREIKKHTEIALKAMDRQFDKLYSVEGRPSVPPETLLKAQLLMALYTVRSDRSFCERLDYDLLFRWFLDMNLDQASFDHSTFSKNRVRLLSEELAQKFLRQVVEIAQQHDLISDEHFTVDGTLIEAWASLKSFKRKDGSDDSKTPDDDPGNPTVDFHGEKRSNKTHESTTDAEARLYRKSNGTEAKLRYCGSVLMENRNGLVVDAATSSATGTAERDDSMGMIKDENRRHKKQDRDPIRTVGGDKNYCTNDYVADLRQQDILPHIAKKKYHTIGLDGRTTRHRTYAISQVIRKRVEEIFGWGKTIGGLRKVRVRGIAKVAGVALFTYAAYDLLRISKLLGAGGG